MDIAVVDVTIDITALVSTMIVTGAGLGGLIWGIHTYRQGQISQRKDIIFPLIKEFDETKEMNSAKRILDGFSYPHLFGGVLRYYNLSNLHIILRYHLKYEFNWNEIPGKDESHLREFLAEIYKQNWLENAIAEKPDDNTIKIISREKFLMIRLNAEHTQALMTISGERYTLIFTVENKGGKLYFSYGSGIINSKMIEIRESFDTLLDFLCKLEYLLYIGLLKDEELIYFKYYIDRAADNSSVVNYIRMCEFPLNGKLNINLHS